MPNSQTQRWKYQSVKMARAKKVWELKPGTLAVGVGYICSTNPLLLQETGPGQICARVGTNLILWVGQHC